MQKQAISFRDSTYWVTNYLISTERCQDTRILVKCIKGQFGNDAAFKIIVVSCAVEIISCEENQLSV